MLRHYRLRAVKSRALLAAVVLAEPDQEHHDAYPCGDEGGEDRAGEYCLCSPAGSAGGEPYGECWDSDCGKERRNDEGGAAFGVGPRLGSSPQACVVQRAACGG